MATSRRDLGRAFNPVRVPEQGVAADYAAQLLKDLSVPVERGGPSSPDRPPAVEWARSGAMALSGLPDGPPLPAPGPVATCARGAATALEGLREGASSNRPAIDGAALLGERAALSLPPLARSGQISVGGSCRLLRCRDGWIALNLARPEDTEVLPAWLEAPCTDDAWRFVADAVLERERGAIVERGRLLGLPIAAVATTPPARARAWCRVHARGPTRTVAGVPVVLDLSSLWAGPLCGQLLERAGARVIKVESESREDGARRGSPAFFDRMNGGKESVALDLTSANGRNQLLALIRRADVVLESSRPRALRQLGIDAEALVASVAGLVWVSITGYGRTVPECNRVAFGDDAAAAVGLVAETADGRPVFCGDAIADPLTGLHAAVATLAARRVGGGQLLDVALANVAAHVRWLPVAGCTDDAPAQAVEPPRAREGAPPAPSLGADTRSVLREFGIPC